MSQAILDPNRHDVWRYQVSRRKIVVQRRTGAGANLEIEQLEADFPEVEFLVADDINSVASLIQDAEALIGMLNAESFRAASRLRWFQAYSTGMDWMQTIPGLVEWLLQNKVVVTNSRGAFAQTIAEHAFALILTLTRDMWTIRRDHLAHRWGGEPGGRPMEAIAGRTMGIFGLGQIGAAIARRAHGFEMPVYAVDAQPFPHVPDLQARWGPDRLDDLCRVSDFLVIAAPLTAETRGTINARRLVLMKSSAYVIAVSRGNIVDEQALIQALQNGRLAGAGLDVAGEEPLPSDNPLWDMDNVVITPHNAGGGSITPRVQWEISVANLRRYLDRKPLIGVVDVRAGY